MSIRPWLHEGTVYLSKGMIFVVLEVKQADLGGLVAKCLLLDDHPSFTTRIPPGTVMDVGDWTTMWHEAVAFQ